MLTAGLWACNSAEKTPAENAAPVVQDTSATVETPPAEVQDTTPPAPYENIEWKLYTLAGEKPFKDAQMTLKMQKGKMTGSGGCNQYSGGYTVSEGGAFSVSSEIASTKRMCEGLMGQEAKLFEALSKATDIKMNKVELVIYSPGGDMVFHHKPAGASVNETPVEAPKKR